MCSDSAHLSAYGHSAQPPPSNSAGAGGARRRSGPRPHSLQAFLQRVLDDAAALANAVAAQDAAECAAAAGAGAGDGDRSAIIGEQDDREPSTASSSSFSSLSQSPSPGDRRNRRHGRNRPSTPSGFVRTGSPRASKGSDARVQLFRGDRSPPAPARAPAQAHHDGQCDRQSADANVVDNRAMAVGTAGTPAWSGSGRGRSATPSISANANPPNPSSAKRPSPTPLQRLSSRMSSSSLSSSFSSSLSSLSSRSRSSSASSVTSVPPSPLSPLTPFSKLVSSYFFGALQSSSHPDSAPCRDPISPSAPATPLPSVNPATPRQNWFARVSRHADSSASSGSASWAEFQDGLRNRRQARELEKQRGGAAVASLGSDSADFSSAGPGFCAGTGRGMGLGSGLGSGAGLCLDCTSDSTACSDVRVLLEHDLAASGRPAGGVGGQGPLPAALAPATATSLTGWTDVSVAITQRTHNLRPTLLISPRVFTQLVVVATSTREPDCFVVVQIPIPLRGPSHGHGLERSELSRRMPPPGRDGSGSGLRHGRGHADTASQRRTRSKHDGDGDDCEARDEKVKKMPSRSRSHDRSAVDRLAHLGTGGSLKSTSEETPAMAGSTISLPNERTQSTPLQQLRRPQTSPATSPTGSSASSPPGFGIGNLCIDSDLFGAETGLPPNHVLGRCTSIELVKNVGGRRDHPRNRRGHGAARAGHSSSSSSSSSFVPAGGANPHHPAAAAAPRPAGNSNRHDRAVDPKHDNYGDGYGCADYDDQEDDQCEIEWTLLTEADIGGRFPPGLQRRRVTEELVRGVGLFFGWNARQRQEKEKEKEKARGGRGCVHGE